MSEGCVEFALLFTYWRTESWSRPSLGIMGGLPQDVRVEELSLPLSGYCTQESEPCITSECGRVDDGEALSSLLLTT